MSTKRRLKETYPRIGELLIRQNLASQEAVDDALAVQRSHLAEEKLPPRLGEILIEKGVIARNIIEEVLDEQKFGRGEKDIFVVNTREHDGIVILSLIGRLDARKVDVLVRILERLMDRGIVKILFDASKLLFINSRSLSGFVRYIDEARARGGDLKIFGLRTDVRMTLENLKITRHIQAFSIEDEAIEAFSLPLDEFMSRGTLGEFVSSEEGKLFHLSFCQQIKEVPEEDRIYFASKWHARSFGKTSCKKCNP